MFPGPACAGEGGFVRVTSFGAIAARIHSGAEPGRRVDLDQCTRCGRPWGFDVVEGVEIWSCSACGYEARERPSDPTATIEAGQESMTS
jgi:ribosomal protein L37AE/L43A